jgi:hypothetical protein
MAASLLRGSAGGGRLWRALSALHGAAGYSWEPTLARALHTSRRADGESSGASGDDGDAARKRAALRRYDIETLRRQRTGTPAPGSAAAASPARSELHRSRQLTMELMACSSCEDVLALLAASLGAERALGAVRLNEFHVSAALVRLNKCSQATFGYAQDKRFVQLLTAAEDLLDNMQPRALANVLYACSKLGVALPDGWVERYWAATQRVLARFSAHDFSNTLYACAQLGLTPPREWQRLLWLSSIAELEHFTPQGLSNTLWACGQLAMVPPSEWLLRYWRVSEMALPHFNSQALSNTLYACCQLALTPPSDWRLCYWQASQAALPQFKQQELSNTLYACGQLALAPPIDWMQQFWAACNKSVQQFNGQACANMLLAVAMLSLWDLPVLHALWQKLNLAVQTVGSAERALCAHQLYQLYKIADKEQPGLLAAPSPEVLEYARRKWRNAHETRTSALHEEVSACLTAMKTAHAKERWCERSERAIDIAIETGTHGIALEVDGPSHYLLNGEPNGPTLLRNRSLAAHGWRVVTVKYSHWDGLTVHQRAAYLTELLAPTAMASVCA